MKVYKIIAHIEEINDEEHETAEYNYQEVYREFDTLEEAQKYQEKMIRCLDQENIMQLTNIGKNKTLITHKVMHESKEFSTDYDVYFSYSQPMVLWTGQTERYTKM